MRNLPSNVTKYRLTKYLKRHKLAIDAAIASGVEYIFYGSLGFAGSESNKETVAHVMKPHLDTERYLEDCRKSHPGFDFTIIREGPLHGVVPTLHRFL